MSLDNWHVACQVPYMEESMFVSFKQKTSVAKAVYVNISKLNTEMIDSLRQLYFPSMRQQVDTEKSQAATQRDMLV